MSTVSSSGLTNLSSLDQLGWCRLIEVTCYEGWMGGKDVVILADAVEDALLAFRGVIIYIDDGHGGMTWLADVENLYIPVFNQVRSQGD